VFGHADLLLCQANHNQYLALCDYTLEISPLARPFENLGPYGLIATLACIEYIQSKPALFLIMAPSLGRRALFTSWASAARARLASIRF
jgi:hypothetical protein